jgi:predicted transcriptional regulator
MSKDDELFENESVDDLKYLLGNMGIEILLAIDRGAKNFKTIKLFTGCSLSCIKGRIPVLLDLNLIYKKNNEYFLTERGLNFKKEIEN